MKILINTPDTSILGGVANHYKGLKPYWSQNVKYNFIGGRKGIPGPIFLIYDYIKFFFLCVFGEYDVILLNPSLGKTAIKRDAIFLKISKWFKIKVVVFFHGWDENLANDINSNPHSFLKKYQKADSFLVLASSFKFQLRNWGIINPVYLTSTKIDDELISEFKIDENHFNYTLLFLARIEENKGIYITLKTLKSLNHKYPNLKLKIAGGGGALLRAKKYVKDNNIFNVEFLGNINGKDLIHAFSKSDIYILPTTHGEGLPTSILEAMAFGLPIISRPVGGLVDFFQEGKMGYLIESLEPKEYADKIIELLENPERCAEFGVFNHKYAKTHFLASTIAQEIEKILQNYK